MDKYLINLKQGRPSGRSTHDPLVAKAFGLAIRRMRVKKGISQDALADISGLGRSHVGRIERGELTPMITVALRLAKGLEVRPGEIFDETEVILHDLSQSYADAMANRNLK